MAILYTYDIENVEPEDIEDDVLDEFVIDVYDRDTYEEFEFTVTKEWLEKYGVDTEDITDVIAFVEMYWRERNCAVEF